jgi:FkbM family methyltransferase
MNIVYWSYSKLFARRFFYRFNKMLYRLAAHGLGMWNWPSLSGEKQFIDNCVKTDKAITVFDVGANVGSYSTEIKNACPNAIIYAFEPHPKSFSKLSALFSHTKHERDMAINVGLGREKDIAKLFDYQYYEGEGDGSEHASLYSEVFQDLQSSVCEVNINTIDSFCAENNITQIELLKMDTEGNEFAILEGAKRMLSEHRIKVIHFEFGDRNIYSRVFMRDFFKILSGYEHYRMLPSGQLKLDYDPFFCEIFGYQNMVAFLKNESA